MLSVLYQSKIEHRHTERTMSKNNNCSFQVLCSIMFGTYAKLTRIRLTNNKSAANVDNFTKSTHNNVHCTINQHQSMCVCVFVYASMKANMHFSTLAYFCKDINENLCNDIAINIIITERNAPSFPSISKPYDFSSHRYRFDERKYHSLTMASNLICSFFHQYLLVVFYFDTHWQANRTHIHISPFTIQHSFVTATTAKEEKEKKCQIKLRVLCIQITRI